MNEYSLAKVQLINKKNPPENQFAFEGNQS